MVYFITWEMHVFSHQVLHAIRKVSETHQMEKGWEIGSHTFSMKWVGFSIRFPSCENTTSHKTHQIGKT